MKKILLFLTLSVLLLAGCNTKTKTETQTTVYVKTDMEERTGDELKIVATVIVKPDAIKDIMPVFLAVVQGSQEEEGNISYNLYQDTSDSTKFTILEEWKSQEAIDFHNNTVHFKDFVAKSADLVEGIEISVIKLVY